ncbi:MAG: U32 family peptidase [Clostridia bacterium]|nr:U32 family peptidase [Clostridia bacterium]
MNKPELLAPAGNLKKLKLAFYYGADAVYLGGKTFSLRSFAENFNDEELAEGIAYAHARGKRVYIAANIFARNSDFPALEGYFRRLEALHADGVLVSDLGVLRLVKRVAPRLAVHISTQANTVNAEAAAMYYSLGASRVVLARELSVAEIAEIHAAVPELELEAFIHGAMCISYSGRCYLSDYIDGRSSNRGACAQPCRYAWEIRAKERKSDWLSLEADERGTYLLNSKDLNMSAHLPALWGAGIASLKIEGRMKSEYYLATVVNAYRRIIDMGYSDALTAELETVTHREYTTAYAFGANARTTSVQGSQYAGSCEFIAIVRGWYSGRVTVEMRTRFYEGDVLEILAPSSCFGELVTVSNMQDAEGAVCPDAKRVQALYTFDCPFALQEGDILRRRRRKGD